MTISMVLWKVNNKELQRLEKIRLDSESRLEDWIANDTSLLGLDIMIIGRQVTTTYGGRVDLLGIYQDGGLVILELKRDKTPRDIVAQTLDYATWIKDLPYSEIDDITTKYLGNSLEEAFRKHFDQSLPDRINTHHSMVIVASEIDDASERIVQYLSAVYGVDINVLFFNYFKDNDNEYLGRSWLMDPERVSESAEKRATVPWTGYWFFNIGDGDKRSWDDCMKYGFLGADVKYYSDQLKRLHVGDKVFAYLKGQGYSGYGIVTKESVMVKDFIVETENKHLIDLPLTQPDIKTYKDDPDKSEWVIGIDWKKVYLREQAKRFTGIFANQNIACKLRDKKTLDFLIKEFEISED